MITIMVTLYNKQQKFLLFVEYILSIVSLYIILSWNFPRIFRLLNRDNPLTTLSGSNSYYFYMITGWILLALLFILLAISMFLVRDIDTNLNYAQHLTIFTIFVVLSTLLFKRIRGQFLSSYMEASESIKYDVNRDLDFAIFYDLQIILDVIISIMVVLFISLLLYRINKETDIIIRIRELYRERSLDIDPNEFSAILGGMLKTSNKIKLQELAELTGQTVVFWKKIIYSLVSRDDVFGSMSENTFTLDKKQNKDEFIYTLGKSINLDMEQNVKSDQLPNIVKDRRCCQMNGRNGDTYCNLCGKAIPQEYVIST